jgi:hypothetical protein
MGLGAALKAVVTRFNFQMEGNKLAAINVAASKTGARFGKAATQAEILQDRLDKVFRTAKMLAGGLLAGLGLKALTVDFANSAIESDRMSKSLGVSLEFFGGLQHALESFNIPGEETSQVIADISERMFDASAGSKALRDDFALIGLTQEKLKEAAKEGPEAQIFALADAMQKAGPSAERTFVAMSGLGDVGKRLLPLLEQGSAGLKKYITEAKQLGVVLDKNAIKQAKIFNKRMVVMKARIRGARNAIAMRLLPAVNDMVGGFSTWIASTENQTKLLWGLAAAAGVAAVAIASMIAPRIIAGFKVFAGQLAKILKLLRAINVQMILMSIKILAVVAAAAFLGLVIEDLIAFVRGDQSVTEQLFGRSQVVIDGLMNIRDTFVEVIDMLRESFGNLWASVVMLAGAFGIKLTTVRALLIGIAKIIFMLVAAALIVVGNILTGIIWIIAQIIDAFAQLARFIVEVLISAMNGLKRAWEDLKEEIVGFFKSIEDAAFVTAARISAFFSRAAEIAKSAWRGVASFLDKVKDKAKGLTGKIKEKLGITKFGVVTDLPAPRPGPGGKPGTTVTGNVVNAPITVVAAPGQSEEKVGKVVKSELQGTINSAFRDMVPDVNI